MIYKAVDLMLPARSYKYRNGIKLITKKAMKQNIKNADIVYRTKLKRVYLPSVPAYMDAGGNVVEIDGKCYEVYPMRKCLLSGYIPIGSDKFIAVQMDATFLFLLIWMVIALLIILQLPHGMG